MPWRDQVAECFGVADKEFGLHPADEGRAKAAIKEAKKAGSTRDDFWHAMLGYLFPLSGGGVCSEHVEKQRMRLRKLWPEKR